MMRRHMGKAMKDVDRVSVVDQFHTFAYILHRHTIVMLVQSYVAVTLYCRDSPLSHLIAVRRQWPEIVPLHSLKELTA